MVGIFGTRSEANESCHPSELPQNTVSTSVRERDRERERETLNVTSDGHAVPSHVRSVLWRPPVAKRRVASTAIGGPYRATSHGSRAGTGGVSFAPGKVVPGSTVGARVK